jgi:hypothetical protein
MSYLRDGLFIAGVICTLMMNLSCVSSRGDRMPDVDVVVWNNTKNKLSNAVVAFSGFQSLGGPYRPGTKKTDSSIPVALPDEITVVWVAEGQKEMRVVVDLTNIHPRTFTGKLFFIIQEDGSVLCEGVAFDDY